MSHEDDADLADLLGSEKVPLKKNGTFTPHQYHRPSPGLCTLLSAHLSYLCFAYPKFCGLFACLASFFFLTFLVATIVNPTQSFGVVPHDWTTVNSVYELDAGKIDHWCLGGGNDGCRCEDPLIPTTRAELRSWTEAYKDNRRIINQYMADELMMADLDVAIVGESAVEEMDGRWLGRFRDDELRNIGTIFRNHFNRDKGADVEGVALGIAGDTAGNVLWRLIHGEMPDGFEPKIWWVSLGANDLTRQQCSEEVVVLGILRVVEEILNRRPKARVVINSLLPMADLRGGTVVTEKDYRDAFSTYRGKRPVHYVRKFDNGVEKLVKKKQSSESSDDSHSRRLLEDALENYHALHNDNSDEIEALQRKLQLEILSSLTDFETANEIRNDNQNTTSSSSTSSNIDNHPVQNQQRRLEEDIPKQMRHDKYNPTIDKDHHKQRKYTLFGERRKPLWTSIYAINKQLWKFCEKHERVDFFDATNIFAERQGDIGQKYFTLLSDKISARGHPTQLGYLEWEDAMVVKIKQILAEMRRDQPELFMSKPPPSNFHGTNPFAQEVERAEKNPTEYDTKNKPQDDDAGGGQDDDMAEGGVGPTQEEDAGREPEGDAGIKQDDDAGEAQDNDAPEGGVGPTEEEEDADLEKEDDAGMEEEDDAAEGGVGPTEEEEDADLEQEGDAGVEEEDDAAEGGLGPTEEEEDADREQEDDAGEEQDNDAAEGGVGPTEEEEDADREQEDDAGMEEEDDAAEGGEGPTQEEDAGIGQDDAAGGEEDNDAAEVGVGRTEEEEDTEGEQEYDVGVEEEDDATEALVDLTQEEDADGEQNDDGGEQNDGGEGGIEPEQGDDLAGAADNADGAAEADDSIGAADDADADDADVAEPQGDDAAVGDEGDTQDDVQGAADEQDGDGNDDGAGQAAEEEEEQDSDDEVDTKDDAQGAADEQDGGGNDDGAGQAAEEEEEQDSDDEVLT